MPHFSLFFIYSLHLIVDLLLQVGLAYFKLGIHVVSNELVLFDVRCELRIHFLLIDRGGLERALNWGRNHLRREVTLVLNWILFLLVHLGNYIKLFLDLLDFDCFLSLVIRGLVKNQ